MAIAAAFTLPSLFYAGSAKRWQLAANRRIGAEEINARGAILEPTRDTT
jgi:hypothetical protein